jgi:superfamily II DNA or RNA helicase
MTYLKSVVKKGQILAGLVPIVKAYCIKEGIDCKVVQNNTIYPTLDGSAELPRITLRPDQERLVQVAIKHHRGVLVSGTGTGKSIIIASIINKYPTAKVLLLAHNKSLIEQLYQTLIDFNLDAGRLTGIHKELDHRIVVATIQSAKEYTEKADIIIIDEAHHVAKEKSKYAKLLINSSANIKIGMTATPQTEGEGFFTQCGCLGPVLDEVTFEEAKEKDLMIPIKLRFLRIPLNDEISKIRAYQEYIEKGICKNNRRNSLIIKTVLEYIEQDKSSLIIITNTDHGKALQEMAMDVHGLDIPFVYGATPMDEREQIKKDLDKKIIKCAIASVVYRHA